VDLIGDGKTFVIGGIMEHIEEAGSTPAIRQWPADLYFIRSGIIQSPAGDI